MDWSYFNDDAGRFRAKRLPSPKGALVRFKDDTDMSDFRYYLSDCRNNNEAIEEYQEYFNDTSSYDIDVEDFRTVMEKSPIGRKSDSTRGMELDTLSELATWERSGSNWLEIGPSLGNALLKAGLVKEKPKLDEDEWDEHLSGRTVAELKELATKAAIPVQGKKSEVVRTLAAAAVEGKLKLKAPLFVQPTDSFDAWFDELQKSYVDDLQNSLRQGYPGCFQATVWSNAIDENAEWPVIVREIRQRHGGLLKKFEYVVPETSNEGNADSIWEVSVSYRDDYSDFDVPGNALSVPGTTVVFDYTSSDGQTTKNRHVDAEQVWSLGRAIYLRGHCHLRMRLAHFAWTACKGIWSTRRPVSCWKRVRLTHLASSQICSQRMETSQRGRSPAVLQPR